LAAEPAAEKAPESAAEHLIITPYSIQTGDRTGNLNTQITQAVCFTNGEAVRAK
jgi:hypothetical protein